MFSRAKVKRFNDEVGCAPAPNAYDGNLPTSKVSGVAIIKSSSRRFDEMKEQTPGPGQYLMPPFGAAGNGRITRNDIFKTPCSTPRKMRHSVSSTGNLSVALSPVMKIRKPEETSMEGLKKEELEEQLRDALGIENEMTSQKEALEREKDLETRGLVEEMEFKLGKHREEATELVERLRQVEITLENCEGERASLLEMNTSLSDQVDRLSAELAALRSDRILISACRQEDSETKRIREMLNYLNYLETNIKEKLSQVFTDTWGPLVYKCFLVTKFISSFLKS
eukprot:GFUD01035935.1.p1 GENE.GFUD01035935.1~~GFUD01035935.1.p1  ORF type:complete len:282 (+),score=84.99 GFUD01035935.1:72-917(+)